MEIHNVFNHILKSLSVLGLYTVFMYWSINAISKYIDRPISSKVTYMYGDDGQGNIDFPAITICLDKFQWVALSRMTKNCSVTWNQIESFSDALGYCTAENTDNDTEYDYYSGGSYGNLFAQEEEKTYPFENIEDFLNVSKTFDIDDILNGFTFGYRKDRQGRANYIANFEKYKLTQEEKISKGTKKFLLDKYWKPTIHFDKGFCYTFEPKTYFGKKPILNKGTLISVSLDLNFLKIMEKLNNEAFCGHKIARIKKVTDDYQHDKDGNAFTVCTKCIEDSYYCEVKYHVLIHHSKETLINDLESDPIVVMNNGEAKLAKISKTNMDSIATNQNPCSEEEELIRTACDVQKAENAIIDMHNCTLPWTNDERYKLCPILDKNRNQSYFDIIKTWEEYYSNKNNECPQVPKCRRTVYKMVTHPYPITPNYHGEHDTKAKLLIEMESSNVQTIQDSIAYDLQSLIGEVGGTLGLFLGLSAMSFVDFVGFIYRKAFPN